MLNNDLLVESIGTRTLGHPSIDRSNKLNGHVTTSELLETAEESPRIPAIPQLRDIVSDYTVTDTPLGTIKPVRIITIGAGASGINMAYQVKNYLKNATMVVYEKNAGVGGTWLENRYPGITQLSIRGEPNPNWNSMFSPADEIRRYLEDCVTKHELSRYFQLDHKVIDAVWNEERGTWNVEIENTATGHVFSDWCHYLLNAGGILNAWRWPSIPGLHDFKGQLVHSANWPEDFDYRGLKVAVIGNGSTGIQIVPALQPLVKELIHLIRSPTWVTPGAASRYPSLRGGNMPEHFSEEQKRLFRDHPEKYLAFREAVEMEINAKFRMLVNGAEEAGLARSNAANSMIELLRDSPDLIGSLIPDFPVGCRRITPGVGYLESFAQPNVRVIAGARIDRVDAEGLIMSTGEHIKVDAIVCATGFDVSFSPRFPITGRDGVSLSDVWGEPNVPQAYLSLAIPKFLNYFTFLGPNAPISHGSVFTITEQCSKYILQLITKAQVELIKAIDVKQEAVDDLAIHIHHFMPRTAWAGNCRSWFKNGRSSGPITAIHPGSRLHWFHALQRPKLEDFNYTYDTGNRFQFLGNGFSTCEEPGEDQTWYLHEVAPKFLYY